jgi:hypothetical protein
MVGAQLLVELAVAERRGDLAGEGVAVGERAGDGPLVVDGHGLHLTGVDLGDEVAVRHRWRLPAAQQV